MQIIYTDYNKQTNKQTGKNDGKTKWKNLQIIYYKINTFLTKNIKWHKHTSVIECLSMKEKMKLCVYWADCHYVYRGVL